MSEPVLVPQPYHVAYSDLVRQGIRNLVDVAREQRRVQEVIAAIRELDRRLKVYPQDGEPLRDLTLEPLQLRIICIYPLVARFLLDESRRIVMLVEPVELLTPP